MLLYDEYGMDIASEFDRLYQQNCRSCAVICDPTLPDTPIIHVTNDFVKWTGYRRDDVIGRNCRFMQGSGTSHQTISDIRDAIHEWKPIRTQILNYDAYGGELFISLSIAPLFNDMGGLHRFVAYQQLISVGAQRKLAV